MTYSIIQKSQLEGANRLDAEYYQPEYLSLANRLNRLGLQPLGNLVDKLDVGFVSSMRDQFQDSGIPLLRTQNVKEFFIDLETEVVYVDEDFHNKSKKTQINPGYVLLARSGSVGAACVVPQNFGVANSADIILISLLGRVDPYFLAAFLNSKYGRFQIERGVSGGIQGHINLYTLEQIQIPTLTPHIQQPVRSTVEAGLEQLDQSKILYSQAERMLLEELGLAGESFEDDLTYIVNSNKMEKAERVDADYFQPKYEKLLSKLGARNAKKFLEVVENVPAKFNPRGEPQQIFKYVELANIDSSIGTIGGSSQIIGSEAPSRARRILETGDVIVSSVVGSAEKVALVHSRQSGYLASTGFFQFRSEAILPEVLLLLAKSVVLQLQLARRTTGAILSAVPNSALESMVIPILPKPTQQKITDLVKKSHQARKKSKELLEEAKRKVEEMVEKGG